jgi:hypothetical protein
LPDGSFEKSRLAGYISNMKDTLSEQGISQPETFTPGISKGMVRQHVLRLYPGKLERGGLSLNDWVMAEKDLVQTRMTEGIEV